MVACTVHLTLGWEATVFQCSFGRTNANDHCNCHGTISIEKDVFSHLFSVDFNALPVFCAKMVSHLKLKALLFLVNWGCQQFAKSHGQSHWTNSNLMGWLICYLQWRYLTTMQRMQKRWRQLSLCGSRTMYQDQGRQQWKLSHSQRQLKLPTLFCISSENENVFYWCCCITLFTKWDVPHRCNLC